MAGFQREVKKRLKSSGWHKVRSPRGSHEIWTHPEIELEIAVPAKIKSRHTANGILKDAGLSKLNR